MIRLSLFISLLLTSVAVLADVQINIRGNVYIPPCTINNGQNIVVDFGNVNPEHVDNSRGEVTKTISISCKYKSGSPWIKVTGNAMAGQTNVLSTNITSFGIALYQGKGTATRLILGDGSGNGYRLTTGLDAANSTFTFTSVPFRSGGSTLNGGEFHATANISIIYI
ncbi:TPA: fimbrial protein [Escherichia coli]|uniref:fimbrial protein n=1 Tax=Escherichia coli TaxID=562 RepID=UPI0005A847E4|nr:fimbrial protein [Escherichia coli]EES0215790.1 fimbrial protein [Escherichia coli]EES9330711.1 fimbrial protein [Escherichia coli]EEY6121398.1 fimbrial protein [Escherichia coli]EFA9625889.1 fimbrial protein [Escherichia coli]EFB5276026.1 fimbrial protein [Escherichia coli]